MDEQLQEMPADFERVLAIVAHPDDMEYGAAGASPCGPTPARTVAYLLVTRGEAGIDGIEPDEVRPVPRGASRRASAACVGVDDVEFLDHRDGVIEHSLALRSDIAAAIRRHRPELVVTLNHHDTWFGRSWNSPDHRNTGRAVLDAVSDAGNRWIFPELVAEGLEPWGGVRWVAIAGSAQPTHAVAIEDGLERADRLAESHASYLDALGGEHGRCPHVPHPTAGTAGRRALRRAPRRRLRAARLRPTDTAHGSPGDGRGGHAVGRGGAVNESRSSSRRRSTAAPRRNATRTCRARRRRSPPTRSRASRPARRSSTTTCEAGRRRPRRGRRAVPGRAGRRCWPSDPTRCIYPTVRHGGGRHQLRPPALAGRAGASAIGLRDPGSVNLGGVGRGRAAGGAFVYANRFDLIGDTFDLHDEHRLGPEPGDLRAGLPAARRWRSSAPAACRAGRDGQAVLLHRAGPHRRAVRAAADARRARRLPRDARRCDLPVGGVGGRRRRRSRPRWPASRWSGVATCTSGSSSSAATAARPTSSWWRRRSRSASRSAARWRRPTRRPRSSTSPPGARRRRMTGRPRPRPNRQNRVSTWADIRFVLPVRRPASDWGMADWVLHVDLDQFLAAVEVLRRPELAGRPVVVGGDGNPTPAAPGGRDRVVRGARVRRALRHAARAALRRCPDAVFLPSRPRPPTTRPRPR